MPGGAALAAVGKMAAVGGGVEAGGAALSAVKGIEVASTIASPAKVVAGGLEAGLATPGATLKHLATVEVPTMPKVPDIGKTVEFKPPLPDAAAGGSSKPVVEGVGPVTATASGGGGAEGGRSVATAAGTPEEPVAGKVDPMDRMVEAGAPKTDGSSSTSEAKTTEVKAPVEEATAPTTEQQARLTELNNKPSGELTVAERSEKSALNKAAESADPGKKYEEIGAKADRGEALTDDEKSFAEKFEAKRREPNSEDVKLTEQEQQVKALEQAGEEAFAIMGDPESTPEEAAAAMERFQELHDKANNTEDALSKKHKESVGKAIKEMLKKGSDGKETREAQELRGRLQEMMQAEAQLMAYKQQLEQVRNQYNQTRDRLRSVDQWWNRSAYDKDPKKRMEKYQLYSQLIGLQEVGKKLMNITQEVKATYASNVATLNRSLQVNGALGAIADYVTAKGYQVNAYAHRNSDWLTQPVKG